MVLVNVGAEVGCILEKHRPECEPYLVVRLLVAQLLDLQPQAAHVVRDEIRAARDEIGLVLDGDVTTRTLGADAAWSCWLGGVAVSLSEDTGYYRDAEAAERSARELESSLTSVHSYARLEVSERFSL